MKKILTLYSCAILIAIATNLKAQDTIVSWTFPSASPDAFADKAISINSSASLSCNYGTIGTSSYHSVPIDFTTNGVLGAPDKSAKATGWNNGADSAYWMISFKTTGYGSLTLSSKIQAGGTNPGPRDFKAQYKISDASPWIDIPGAAIVCGNDWTTGALANLALPAECSNLNSQVFLRWLLTSNTTFNGGTLAAAGISKMDDIFVKGTPSTSIEDYTKIPVVSVFPNPATDAINISSINGSFSVDLINSSGSLVYSLKTIVNGAKINTSDLPKGLYFLIVRDDMEVVIKTTKVILISGKN